MERVFLVSNLHCYYYRLSKVVLTVVSAMELSLGGLIVTSVMYALELSV
jgi:hypothetical protein